MEWYIYALSALGSLLLGALAGFVNMKFSKLALKKDDFALVMGINVLRYLNDALILAAVYFICRRFELPLGLSLLSAAAGLTILGMLFLGLMTKHQNGGSGDNGGEQH